MAPAAVKRSVPTAVEGDHAFYQSLASVRVLGDVLMSLLRRLAPIVALALLAAAPGHACVGANCMTVWSTADGGGALTIAWDFEQRGTLQTFERRCAGGDCLYNTIDPGFLSVDDQPPAGLYEVATGTPIDLRIDSIDPAAKLKINGVTLAASGDSVRLGLAGTLHAHPTWQLTLPEGVVGDYPISFFLRSDSGQYADSALFTVLLTNRPPPPTETPTMGSPSPTRTPTATAEPAGCAGDCDGNGMVTIAELVGGVASALGNGTPCAALDRNGDGKVTIGELVAAVAATLEGCPQRATPTATSVVTLADIQAAILSPRCAIPTCHDSAIATGGLVLEGGASYDQLVGVEPMVEAARDAGQLRVDPGDPSNSFLLIKLTGPPLGQGGRMPLTGALLSDEEVELVRAWIAGGAPE